VHKILPSLLAQLMGLQLSILFRVTLPHKIGHYLVACYFYQRCKNIRTPRT